MPTNPYESPQESDADGNTRFYRVRHDAKFWLWAVALAASVAPIGAALGIFALIAVWIAIALLNIPLAPVPFDPWTVAVVGGILIGELVVVKWVLDRSNRIRAVHYRIALKSLDRSVTS